jgi:hypothetical protein
MADFYWVGSTAANVNSLSWNRLTNWRTITVATGGATLARWSNATRFPMGSDRVFIGSVVQPAGPYMPVALPVYSPLLFGGLTTGAGSTAGSWTGSTAGTQLVHKKGLCNINVLPTYPFSQVGGSLNTTILNEWASQTRLLGLTAIAFGITGNTADGEDTAQYFSSAWGTTSGSFTVSKPAEFIGENCLRVMGTVNDFAKSPTRCFFRGYTAGATGTNGYTYAYDGSGNYYNFNTITELPKAGTSQNRTVSNGTITEVPTPENSFYTHGDAVISGYWNNVGSYISTKGGSIFGVGLVCNAFALAPSYAAIYSSSTTYPIWKSNGYSGSTPTSWTEYDTISFDQASNTKTIRIGGLNNGLLNYVNNINVEGDVTASSGFPCQYPPMEGGNTGGTAGNTTITTSGNLILNPNIYGQNGSEIPTTCTVGYPFSDANFRGNNLTNIDYIYNMNGSGYEYNIGAIGNLNTTEAFMYGGSFFVSPQISDNNNVSIGQLSLFGNSTLDLSQALNHKGIASEVVFRSRDARLLPKDGTKISLTSDELVQDAGDLFE